MYKSYKSHVCIEKNISRFAPPRASARAAAAGRTPPGRDVFKPTQSVQSIR